MKKIVTKEKFIKIFENMKYRKELDNILLNFFGLEANTPIKINTNNNKSVFLEFMLFVNTEYILKIIVEDTKKLFKEDKSFFINISLREVDKYHELLMPCYWEIYSLYSFLHQKNEPKLLLIAALFSCKTEKQIRDILNKLKVFKKEEIDDIINTLNQE